jgi:nucleotide-binding universal stress UspA family protein
MKAGEKIANLKVLVAVDDSEMSLRAVSYAGEMLKDLKAVKVHILHIINDPEEDFFPDMKQKEQWLIDEKKRMAPFLNRYREVLLENAIPGEHISLHLKVRSCPSIAECILNERKALDCKTVVIGRKGVSREEEFLFGSVSNRIIHKARACTVWVVE